jgi:hypothetical protein
MLPFWEAISSFQKNYNELSKVAESGHLDSGQNLPHWHAGPIFVGDYTNLTKLIGFKGHHGLVL